MTKTAAPDVRTPVSILTGFLGAGKTTLLNRLLHEHHGLKLAIIENEFGAESIDSEILLQESSEEIIQLDNGCLCCSVRGDLARALQTLAARRATGALAFDRVVIETTGIADPGPVAQTLFMDAGVAAVYRLEAIVTVVDALHGLDTLAMHAQARAQVGYADRVLMSKTDVAAPDAAGRLRERIAGINPEASVVDVHAAGFAIARLLEVALPDAARTGRDARFAAAEGGHGKGANDAQDAHISDVQAITFTTTQPIDRVRLEHFLAAAVDICGNDLFRVKGVLWIDGMTERLLLQGVQLTMQASAWGAWPEGERRSRLVLIGRELPAAELKDSLRRCVVPNAQNDEGGDGVRVYRNVGALGAGWLA